MEEEEYSITLALKLPKVNRAQSSQEYQQTRY